MKSIYLSVLAILFSTVILAQTIVDTTSQNKNVVLEEFTGIHCTYCPDGHKIAQQMHNAHPNDVFIISIQEGSFAFPYSGEPDFRTPFGTALASQAGVVSYPSGTINRHIFIGSITKLKRSKWNAKANIVLGQASYVNVACEANVDTINRLLTVHVEIFYTGNSPQSTNKLNIALLQNNIEGPQAGSSYNPSQVLPNGNYNHKHLLRHLITGQWGTVINLTSAGTFIDTTFTYTVPADFNGVVYDLSNLDIVAFVAETNQEIISGDACAVSTSSISVGNKTIIDNSLEQINIYPNPTSNILNIKTKENSSIVIYNIVGEQVYSLNNFSKKITVDMSNMARGSYIVKIMDHNSTIIRKVVLID